jgi:hypothetical protein
MWYSDENFYEILIKFNQHNYQFIYRWIDKNHKNILIGNNDDVIIMMAYLKWFSKICQNIITIFCNWSQNCFVLHNHRISRNIFIIIWAAHMTDTTRHLSWQSIPTTPTRSCWIHPWDIIRKTGHTRYDYGGYQFRFKVILLLNKVIELGDPCFLLVYFELFSWFKTEKICNGKLRIISFS